MSGESRTTRAPLVAVAAVLLAFLAAQVAIAGPDERSRAGAPAKLVKQVSALKKRIAALEGKPTPSALPTPSTLPPTGPAGGDLAGTYPSPSLKPPEAVIEAGLGDSFPLGCGSNGWYDVSPDVNQPVGYYRDRGRVHLQGLAQYCGGPISPIFTLPPGYRPARHSRFQTQEVSPPNSEVTVIEVRSTGQVQIGEGGSNVAANNYIALDGMSFRCGPSGANGCP